MAENTEQIGISNEEMRFDLTPDEVFGYLKRMAPRGFPCAVCMIDSWGVSIVEGRTPEGKTIQRVYPDGVLNHAELHPQNSDANTNLMRNSGRSYSFTCTNCGHQVRFAAGVLAARTAFAKRPSS